MQNELKINGITIADDKIAQDETTGEITIEMPSGNKYKITADGEIKEAGAGTGEETPPEGDETVILDTSGANYPELKAGMTAITYNLDGSENTVTDSTKRDWYNYAVQTTATDTYNKETGEWGTSHWANAKLNGNYYVWIPRYAYKIDTSVTYTSQSGESHKIDVIFLDENNKKADGTEIEGLITDYTEVNETKNATTNYVLHPAFTFGEDELSGIWVGKWETSGTESAPTVLPNKTAATDLSVAQMFEMSKNVITSEQKTNLDAHMMKNTEWGAVAYLTQSQYGRNGIKAEDGTVTLGYTGFITKPENKYYNLYTSTSADSTNIGDALYETKGWNSDYAIFVNSSNPVFGRSSYYGDASIPGAFYFYSGDGGKFGNSSFRVCIAVK